MKKQKKKKIKIQNERKKYFHKITSNLYSLLKCLNVNIYN